MLFRCSLNKSAHDCHLSPIPPMSAFSAAERETFIFDETEERSPDRAVGIRQHNGAAGHHQRLHQGNQRTEILTLIGDIRTHNHIKWLQRRQASPIEMQELNTRALGSRMQIEACIVTRKLQRIMLVIRKHYLGPGNCGGNAGKPEPTANLENTLSPEIPFLETPTSKLDGRDPDVSPVRETLVAGKLLRIQSLQQDIGIENFQQTEGERSNPDFLFRQIETRGE